MDTGISLHRIFLGHLPFHVEASTLIAALAVEFQPDTAHITITPFGRKQRKKKGCEDKLHPGFGYAEVKIEASGALPRLIQRLRSVENLAGEAVNLKVELAQRPVLASSISSLSNTTSAVDDTDASKNRLAQRQHKKRQRTRSTTRRNGLLLSLIGQIPEPGGTRTTLCT